MGDSETSQGPNSNILEQIVGKGNEDKVFINKVETRALIDSGSMISTVTEEFLEHLEPKPEILPLENFDLDIKVAGGYSLPYKGYVTVNVTVPFLRHEQINVPMLVVPLTEYTETVPVIVGTNIIRQFKSASSDDSDVPEGWKLAMTSICNKQAGVVKTTNKIVLQPLESKLITGFARKTRDVEAVVTEPAEDGTTSRLLVCPRVVGLNKPGTSARIPVRICNISAKAVTIPAKSLICELNEVDVLRSADITSKSGKTSTVNVQQQQATVSENTDTIKLDLSGSCLTETEKEKAQEFLSRWQHIFSRGPLDLGHTHTVKHEINLEDEAPFKEPYRHIPPALFQEVREHLREMLQVGAIRESSSPFSSNVQ